MAILALHEQPSRKRKTDLDRAREEMVRNAKLGIAPIENGAFSSVGPLLVKPSSRFWGRVKTAFAKLVS